MAQLLSALIVTLVNSNRLAVASVFLDCPPGLPSRNDYQE